MARLSATARLALLASVCLGPAATASAQDSLDDVLRPRLEKYQLPAFAAAVVKDGKVVAAGAVGTRRVGTHISVTLDDRFHLGSDTKAMTALLAGMLVEEGKLRWDMTAAELFPALKEKMTPALRGVTLEQFLSHTSGVPADDDALNKLLARSMQQDGNLDEIRAWLLEEWVGRPLAGKPGEQFVYANMNFVVVGAALERLTGKTWDELITERIFVPLKLRTAGLGAQSSLGRVDAPLGHMLIDGKLKAFLAGPNGDNPSVIGPAGIAHMSVLDFAAWAGWCAGEGKRGPALVRPATLKKLHAQVVSMAPRPDAKPGTPSRGKYGLGWGQMEFDWAPVPLLFHGGSNVKNLAYVFVEPGRDFAMVLMANVGGTKPEAAMHEVAPLLYKRFAGAAAAP